MMKPLYRQIHPGDGWNGERILETPVCGHVDGIHENVMRLAGSIPEPNQDMVAETRR
ncbi:MAG: hypothetical protein ABGZ35_31545 [Planctomycetaceae bacterium]